MRVAATEDGATGEAASAVRRMPVAAHGWRPTSATVQPEMMAMKTIGQVPDASLRNRRESSSRPRSHWIVPQAAIAIMIRPRPTISRKAKNGIATGGRSEAAKSLGPGKRPGKGGGGGGRHAP